MQALIDLEKDVVHVKTIHEFKAKLDYSRYKDGISRVYLLSHIPQLDKYIHTRMHTTHTHGILATKAWYYYCH